MNEMNLYNKLKEAYSESNLNNLTSRIIKLYRNKNFNSILNIGKKVKEYTHLDLTKTNRVFNQLVLLYHPDKYSYYRNLIDKYNRKNDQDKLHGLSHILIIQKALLKNESTNTSDFTDLYASQVNYGLDKDDLQDISEAEFYTDERFGTSEEFNDFLEALQKQEKILDVSDFWLEQLEGELDISDANITDLNGLENCINLMSLDLSHNKLIDVTAIGHLHRLEFLYLSDNNISDIEILSHLSNLKYIDLSFNDIADISPLLDLPDLTFLNVIGNPIPDEQIDKFSKNGIIIIA